MSRERSGNTAGIGIVDTADLLGEKSHRIRHAQLDHTAADQGTQRSIDCRSRSACWPEAIGIFRRSESP
jgi:hypothetical protein